MLLVHVQCLELYHVHYKHPIILVVVITISNTMITQAASALESRLGNGRLKSFCKAPHGGGISGDCACLTHSL